MQGFIHNQKGSGVVGDIIERYVYANETIEAGTFVEFVNGLSEGSILTTSPVNLQCDTSNGLDFEAELLSENKVILAYYDYYGNSTTEYLKVRIITINKNQIILGDEYTLNDVASRNIQIEVLNPNSAIIVYSRSELSYLDYGYTLAISITDDGVITPSNIVNFSDNVKYMDDFAFCKISNTSAVLLFIENSQYCNALVITYTSSTNNISIGSKTTLSSVMSTNPNLVRLKDNEVVAIYTDSTNDQMIAKKLTINGTSISTNFTATLATADTNNGKEPTCNGIIALATDRFLIKYTSLLNDNSVMRYVAYKIFNNNFVPGNIMYIESSSDSALNRMIKVDNYTVFSFYNSSYWVLDIRDTYVSLVGEGTLPHNISYMETQFQEIAQNRIFFVTDTSPYFVGAPLVVDGYKLTNEIIEGTFETQIRKATTSKIDGVARTTGTGGSRTEHGETIQVYVPKI